MKIIEQLKKNSEVNPSKVGFIDEDGMMSNKEMYDAIINFSNSKFLENQAKVITLVSENSLSFLIGFFGIIKSGKIVHIIPSNISKINLDKQILNSNTDAIIVHNEKEYENFSKFKIPIYLISDFKSNLGKTNNFLSNNQISHLIYTSGTTDIPKGVPISHEMIEFTTNNIVNVLKYNSKDIDLIPLPLHHSFGLGCIFTSITAGSTIVLMKNVNNLENFFQKIEKYKITTIAALPITLTKSLKFEKNFLESKFSNIRLIITNSTTIPKNTINQYVQILKNGFLATYYGLTESSRSTFMIFNNNSKFYDSVGKMAPGVNIRIDKNISDDLELGEIMINGKNVLEKYWNNYDADKKIESNWLRTGDLGYIDNEGYLFLKGRTDDIINIGGEKVVPNEIENVVKQIDGVEEVIAFGIQNDVFGQVIKLNVIKNKNSNLKNTDIIMHCLKKLEKFKIPSKVEFVDTFPKNEYGKVKRFELK